MVSVGPLHLSRRDLIGLVTLASIASAAHSATVRPAVLFDIVSTPDGRRVPISFWCANGRRRGTILFSHGALSAPAKYRALIEPWAAQGFDVLAPLHVDSTDHPDTAHYPGLASWKARLEDVHLVAARIKGTYIAAGHSYGGLVALTLAGASPLRPDGYRGPMADPRVTAVVAFSPPGPTPTLIDPIGFTTLAVPALIETGTKDIPPGGKEDGWEAHLEAFRAPPLGGARYGLVLDGVDHYFGNLICRPDRAEAPQTARFADALSYTNLFLDGYGARSVRARHELDSRLRSDGPVRLMRR